MSARQVARLIGAGTRCLGEVLSGRGHLDMTRLGFVRALLTALRPHFFALPAGAALAGGAASSATPGWRIAAAAALSGLGWGVGQLLNDLLDREADMIDAPDRPAVRGALPEGPTMLVAMLLGGGIAASISVLHPGAAWLALGAALLLVGYGPAKRMPLLGNVAHGALVAVAALIGGASATPTSPLSEVVARTARTALVVGGWAMVYLEANYEKDRRGDGMAGYLTLPRLIGLRASAALRGVGAIALALFAYHRGLLAGEVARAMMALGVLLVIVSSSAVLRAGTEQAALRGYRASVHAAALGLLALGCPALGNLGTLGVTCLNGLVVERAFRRSPNP
jgi:geranylgeranylglycerol-phosphate geranylgeranyltransferase